MKLMQVMRVKSMKLKRSYVMLIIVGAPLLLLALQYLNFTLRASVMLKPGNSPWWELIQEVGSFWGALLLPLMTAIVAGMVCATEHTSHAWKYILTMPIGRGVIYMGKLLLTLLLLVVSSLILTCVLIGVGLLLNFQEAIPWEKVGWVFLYPLLGSAAIIAIQVWLSTRFYNPSIPLGIGVASVVGALFLSLSPYMQWYPWVYPFMTAPVGDSYAPGFYSFVSVGVGLICTGAGLREFSRREI